DGCPSVLQSGFSHFPVFPVQTVCGGCPQQRLPPLPSRHNLPCFSAGLPPLSPPPLQALPRGLFRPYSIERSALPDVQTFPPVLLPCQRVLPLPLSLSLTAAVMFPVSVVSLPLSFQYRTAHC